VNEQARRRRRYPEQVVGSAVVVGLASAVPIALLNLLGPNLVRELAGGAGVGQAWAASAPASDDWEMLPWFLVAALVLATLVSVVAAAVWLLVTARTPERAWAARVAAATAAAAVPLLLLLVATPSPGVLTAIAAGLIALVAAPRVGYGRKPSLGSP
jgi:cytochrome bd-type quinol oxidase subunit 2